MRKSKLPTFLLGYDVERQDKIGFEETRKFLKVAAPLHQELHAPCTFFICGKTLEGNMKEFQEIKKNYPFIDLQQHTYSHTLLKTVVMETEKGIEVYKGGTLAQIEEEVRKTNELLKKYLDVDCIGLTGPYGYYRGLSDRPDILEILHRLGIRFTRTYARNEKDYQPVSFKSQPFWYKPQGFSDILEFPIQGWMDVYFKKKYGWGNIERYLNDVKTNIDYIVTHNLTWCYAQHDWSSIKEDPEMEATRRIIKYALERGVRLMSYFDYYKECLKTKEISE